MIKDTNNWRLNDALYYLAQSFDGDHIILTKAQAKLISDYVERLQIEEMELTRIKRAEE
jgi:surfactin synthase thioesterase subunit